MVFRHGCIIGLGLLGGGLALDLRRLYPEMQLTGIARRQDTLREAAELQCDGAPIFTGLSCELSAVREADLIVLCAPVQTIIDQLAEIPPFLTPGTVITDVGSTKRAIMNAAVTALPSSVHFIGGHPMAGSDRKGLAHARTGIFRQATWALCIPPGAEEAADRLEQLITDVGACPLRIDQDTHDDIVALTSHLPHIVAAALTNCVLGSSYQETVVPFIAGGFRDSTRVAAASPAMWRDICLTNRDRITAALDELLADIASWREAIHTGDTPHLEALLTIAAQRRERLNTK